METWKDIPGYEGSYQVSSHGQVRSLDRSVTYANGRVHTYKGQMLKPFISNHGYFLVSLGRASLGCCVHQLVMLSFVGPPSKGQQVRHLDGNPLNNAVSNLCYGTPSENGQDRVYHGSTKLSADDVRVIRKERAKATPCKALAQRFGVSPGFISHVARGRWHGHVE